MFPVSSSASFSGQQPFLSVQSNTVTYWFPAAQEALGSFEACVHLNPLLEGVCCDLRQVL